MSLSRLNWIAAAAHTAAAVVSWQILKSKRVTLYEIDFDLSAPQVSDIDYPQTLKSARGPDIKSLVVAFYLFTAFAHVLYATDFFGKGWYSNAINGWGWNPFRWVEYSVSAGIMAYIIALFAGSKEKSAALTVALLIPGLMSQGFTIEREIHQGSNYKDADAVLVWANVLPAWLLYGVKWFIIFNALRKLQKAHKDQLGTKLDSKVTFLVMSQFIFFTLFGVVNAVQVYRWYKKIGANDTYLVYEKAYIWLSLIAKVGLGLSVGNVLK